MRVLRSRLVSRLVTGVLLLAGGGILAFGLTMRLADLHFQTVLSGSMRPSASPGDLAVTQGVPVASIHVGDVIAFVPPTQTRAVLHRVATLQDGVITTKGDANNAPDPWHVALTGTTAYRLVAVVPYAGWLTELAQPAFALAGLLIAVEILLELRKEVRRRTTRPASQVLP